jgi:hypothetical protein
LVKDYFFNSWQALVKGEVLSVASLLWFATSDTSNDILWLMWRCFVFVIIFYFAQCVWLVALHVSQKY